MIRTAHENILEAALVSLAAGTEDPDYPLYRLFDRNTGRMFRPTSAGTVEIRTDQGQTPRAADRLLIPSGHNLDGMTLSIGHSDDDVVYSPAVPAWTQEGTGLIERSWSAETRRYWKFSITPAGTVPELAELFLTATYEWERNPARPAGPLEDVFNVENAQTAGGQDRFLVYGGPKRQRVYHMPRCGEAQKDGVVALNDAWAGAHPFWLCDHEGNWIYGRLAAALNLKETAHRAYSFDFSFLEVLP